MAGLVKTGQAVTVVFCTSLASTGASSNADSTPTGTLYVNGTANGATVTVTNITTGVYKAAVTLPSLSAGDVVDLRIAATVSTVAGNGVVWSAIADTYRISDSTPQTGDSYARIGAAGAGLTAVADTSGTTTLLSRLSSARAGYLDNLSAGAAALASALASAAADITTLLGRLTSTRAGYLDNLSGGAPATAANVWAYATRTLTQGAASVIAAVTGGGVTVYRGTRWSITLTGLPTNTGYTSILFSAKHRADDTDAAAAVLVRKNSSGSGDGLIAFEGATVTAGQASITVNSATSITITVEAATTQYAAPGDYRYGIKYLDASGYPSQASSGGTFSIEADIPKAIT